MSEDLTPEEVAMLEEYTRNPYPTAEEKHNIFTFFKEVAKSKDTTRTSNLDTDELGLPKLPVRTNLQLELYCKKQGLSGLSGYFFDESQIITNPALSKQGFLDKLVVTQTRQMQSEKRTKAGGATNKGWFGKRKEATNNMSEEV